MNDSIMFLIELQKIDLKMDRLQEESEKLQTEIEGMKQYFEEEKKNVEGNKKNATQLKIDYKNMEIEAAAKDEEAKKHLSELNIVKSNEAYKALLSEIEKVKEDKVQIEDKMLGVMQEIEDFVRLGKEEEQLLKVKETDFSQKIQLMDVEIQKFQEQINGLNQERQSWVDKIVPDILQRYFQIRENKNGLAVVPIENGGYCGGCRIVLPAYILNEAKRDKKIIYCENCARIVYYPLESMS